jgi:molecular chaperone DnaK (HSP70)
MAGLHGVRLLEEPQAALYDWLYRHRATLAQRNWPIRGWSWWRRRRRHHRLQRWCRCRCRTASRCWTRIGVGNHLILGGDNMDLALAHLAESRLPGRIRRAARLSAAAWRS